MGINGPNPNNKKPALTAKMIADIQNPGPAIDIKTREMLERILEGSDKGVNDEGVIDEGKMFQYVFEVIQWGKAREVSLRIAEKRVASCIATPEEKECGVYNAMQGLLRTLYWVAYNTGGPAKTSVQAFRGVQELKSLANEIQAHMQRNVIEDGKQKGPASIHPFITKHFIEFCSQLRGNIAILAIIEIFHITNQKLGGYNHYYQALMRDLEKNRTVEMIVQEVFLQVLYGELATREADYRLMCEKE